MHCDIERKSFAHGRSPAILGALRGMWLCGTLLAACSVDAFPQTEMQSQADAGSLTRGSAVTDQQLHGCKVETGQACSLPACGCPETQTCAPDPSEPVKLKCQPHNRRLAEACGKDQQCAPGLFCSENGLCVELCQTDSDCGAGQTGSCAALNWQGKEIARGCAIACDPENPQNPGGGLTACASGFGCDPVGPGVVDCTPHVAGAKRPGGACTGPQDCAPGSTCSEATCTSFCQSDADCAGPGAGSRCIAFPSKASMVPDLKICGERTTATDKSSSDSDDDDSDDDDSDRDASSGPGQSAPPMMQGTCTPGEQSCDDITPRRCSSAGEWENEAITAGRCGAVCASGDTSCEGTTLRTCGNAGRWEGASIEAGSCGAECTPGNEECNGNSLMQCSDSGVWQVMSVEGGVCDAACTPGETQCRGVLGAVLWTCSSAGNWGNAHVEAGSCGAICNPGEPGCNGVTSFTCGLIGQWLPGTIVGGSCGAICSPGEISCDGTVRYTCYGGTDWLEPTISTDCGADCNPRSQTCSGSSLFTCDGNGYWDAGYYSESCEVYGTPPECNPGELACGLLDDPFYCTGAGPCRTWSDTVGDVYLTFCDSTGRWARSDCEGVCTRGSAGLSHFCLLDGSASGCYANGVCP